uniref:Polyprotein protein n=1 Tax=Solanum tuberosum TaxID=4113 RepID=M1DJF1_SOLTU
MSTHSARESQWVKGVGWSSCGKWVSEWNAFETGIEFPANSEIHLATMIGDAAMANDDAKLEAFETAKEELGTQDSAVYDDLEDLKGVMVQTVVEASIWYTSMVGSSGAKDGAKSGTDAPTEGVTDMQSSPQA